MVFFFYLHSILSWEDFILDIIHNFRRLGNFVKTETKIMNTKLLRVFERIGK